MGGGISICNPNNGEIKCPKNYDKKKFQKILMLYDKLDTNGNMVMEQEEFYVLANHHIKNQKELILREKTKNKNDIQRNILMLNLKYEEEKKEMEKSHNSTIDNLENKEKTDDIDYNKRLTNIDLLTKEEKYEIFKERFTDNDNKINFTKFFEYMKTRSDDIENINWITSGKLDHLKSPNRLSVTINSPNARPRVTTP
tara:strand:+ start:400 stop:993 length:594 start_codon:yes stop_codon:yes gene_type:complete